MIHYLINLLSRLIEAIKRGLLRIFPLPITYRQAVIVIVIVIVGGVLIGCGTQRQVTQLVHDIQRDTIYMNSQQYDSIYIYKDVYRNRSKDTVYLKDISVEYRYKLLRDTVRIVHRDSIPYEVTVVETKEITRPLTFYDRICRLCFWFMIGAVITFTWTKLRKR